MSIILNEYEWAENMINNHELGKKPLETLNRVSKYYVHNQYSNSEIRRLLDVFLVQCDPTIPLSKWSDTLDRVVKNARKYPLINIDGIPITDKELERIEFLEGKQIRRLAFTLLCVAKYWDMVSSNNNHWVNTSDKEIIQMANINTSIKRQSLMFAQLRDCDMLSTSKKIDNLNVRVNYIIPGDTAMYIQDFRNLGYQYLKHYGGPYFKCVNCGITTKESTPDRGRKPKYCPSCASELHTKQKVESVMRSRALLN